MNWYKTTSKYDLPVKDNDPQVTGGEGQLAFTIENPNSEISSKQHGSENLVFSDGNIEKYEGEYGSFRYLYKEKEQIIGGVQGAYNGNQALLSSMYVAPEKRGLGIATSLINYIENHENNVILSNFFTEEGASFFGITK